MVYSTPEYHPAFEEYCETIFELAEDDLEVIRARIADRLDVSRAAVSEMIRKLEEANLVAVDKGEITLTEDGHTLASSVVRRHRLAERFLTDMLELSWTVAHHEAGKWEHVISSEVEAALVKVLDDPTTCPHGNPIPGSDYTAPDAKVLSSLRAGDRFRIERIPEELEFRDGMLEFLETSKLLPGQVGEVTMVSPEGTTTVAIDGGHVGVGQFAATRILVSADS